MPQPLPTYLRTFRLRSGLSQDDVAFLLGVKRGSLVSRHELSRRLPPLETALAYEVVYGTPIRELFAGRFREVEQRVQGRATRLAWKAKRRSPTQAGDRKIAFLRSICERT